MLDTRDSKLKAERMDATGELPNEAHTEKLLAPPAPADCSCQQQIQEMLTRCFVEEHPKARDHSAHLKGYALIFKGNLLLSRPYMPVELKAVFPLKNGGEKQRVIKQNMMFSYCPFCGLKFGTAE